MKIIDKAIPAVLAAAFLSVSCAEKNETELLLERLDNVLSMQKTYDSYLLRRVEVLSQIRGSHNDPERAYELGKRLADEYSAFSLDSTVHYLRKNLALAHEMNDRFRIVETELALAMEYAMTGYHVEAAEIIGQYSSSGIPEGLKIPFYSVRRTLAGELMAYAQDESIYHGKYLQREAYRDTLLSMIPEGTYAWYDLKREEADVMGEDSLQRVYTKAMLDLTRENSHDYAKACFFYHYCFEDEDRQIEWLARSAIADVMSATKDYASLQSLSRLLFNRGDINRAFRYTADYSMPDAIFFNGKLRPWQIALFFPEIERSYEAAILSRRKSMTMMIIVVSALLLLLIIMLFILYRRQRTLVRTRKELEVSYSEIEMRNRDLESINSKLTALNGRIQEADKVKQEYIAQFLMILSENISRSRQYKNHVLKYIRRGNEKYLAEEIETLPSMDEDIHGFYRMFDSTFINLYPDFVEQFNSLLTDGEALIPKGDDILTPELRIFALIKLGITDSSRIASLLHYSANTIYNYRAKIKNKAKGDRDKFEEMIKGL